MRIQIPSTSDASPEQWFAQMRIVLKAAEKMYQQMVQDYGKGDPSEGGDNPWINIRLEQSVRESLEKGESIDIDSVLPDNLYLDVDHL